MSFVMVNGEEGLSVMPFVMQQMGLREGQSVDYATMWKIIEANRDEIVWEIEARERPH